LKVAEAVKQITNYNFSTYTVVEDGGGFAGMVSEARLRRMMA
jgi:CBS domain-containing protein